MAISTLGLLVTVFGVIFVAELPDKTAIATFVLATRQKAVWVFAGSAAALTIQSLVAVALGGVFAALPRAPVAVVTGFVFLVSAVVMWRKKDDAEDEAAGGGKGDAAASTAARTFARTFAVVFAAEWGDITQVGTAALAARYGRPIVVLVGATLALWAVAGLAVFAGHFARRSFNPAATRKVAAVMFGVVGVVVMTGAL
jgi:Ca2+/H+ antiporter, TMEM165/GDT1 family